MKEIPSVERPYEKCVEMGPESLTDIELLAVFLRTGTKGENAVELAKRILYDSGQNGILGIHHFSLPRLLKLKGIGKVKAIQILCLSELAKRLAKASAKEHLRFSSPTSIADYYMEDLRHESQEVMKLLMLNTKAELICEEDGEVLSVEDGDLQMLLGEMDAERYDNTVSMSQRNAQMGESIVAELKNYATNYYTSGNGEIDLAGALEQLRDRKKILENEIRMEMAQKQQKREKLEQEVSFVWRDVHHLEEELERVEEELAYRLEKEEEKKKERQREEEHGKGVMDEIRPEKWRIHPMELLVFALVIVIAVILFSKPWNYLIAIVLFLAFGLYIWNRMKVGKKQVKTEPEIILEEITQEEEKVPVEKLRWEKSHITAELKEKKIQYDNLGEQLAELDEVNERSREYEMKRQAVQMAADHLEQLSEEMRGYLKRDLNEKASSFICEITGGKYKKLVTDEKLHVSLMTDEKRVEIEQVSRGTVEQVYLALRMAVGELLCEEEMPVILDDAFAYYDEERMLQTLRWLKEHKKQVIIFTCQTREEQVMKEAGLVYHKIEL